MRNLLLALVLTITGWQNASAVDWSNLQSLLEAAAELKERVAQLGDGSHCGADEVQCRWDEYQRLWKKYKGGRYTPEQEAAIEAALSDIGVKLNNVNAVPTAAGTANEFHMGGQVLPRVRVLSMIRGKICYHRSTPLKRGKCRNTEVVLRTIPGGLTSTVSRRDNRTYWQDR
jgi:hypothetical protein